MARADPLTLTAIDEAIKAVLGGRADHELIRQLRPLLLEALFAGATDIAALLESTATLHVGQDLVQAYLEDHIPQLVGINEFVRRRVRNVIAESVANGDSLSAQVQTLQDLFTALREGNRAELVARTEGGIAWNVGQHAQMEEFDVPASVWITSRDARVRDTHIPMEAQCRPLDQPFISGAGVELRFPCDPEAPIEEIANCRCVTAPFPHGCGDERFLATYEARTAYWRAYIAKLVTHERVIAKAVRQRYAVYRHALFAALDLAA